MSRAAGAVPARATASYDVRTVIDDVCDEHTFLELRPNYAPNMVTGLGRLGGRPVGIVANQPMFRAGTLDIEASRKAARFVQWCDAFNFPIVTFVDTPGFEPGRDLEWRGMIRHGAELVHAYAEATVPRLCLLLRKAYGGAYIVMDSKNLGNDWCMAWPTAEVAVMGAPGAVQILHRRQLAAIDDAAERMAEQLALEAEYSARFANPYVAAERGLRRRRHRRIGHSTRPRRRARAVEHQARAAAGSPSLQHTPLSREGSSTVLQGKRILVTGVLNDASIAFSTARLAQEQGAEVILSSFGRVMRLTERTAKRLPNPDVQIVELDVTNEDDLAALAGNVGGKLDGVLHSLGLRARVLPRRRLPRRAVGRTCRSRSTCRRTRSRP